MVSLGRDCSLSVLGGKYFMRRERWESSSNNCTIRSINYDQGQRHPIWIKLPTSSKVTNIILVRMLNKVTSLGVIHLSTSNLCPWPISLSVNNLQTFSQIIPHFCHSCTCFSFTLMPLQILEKLSWYPSKSWKLLCYLASSMKIQGNLSLGLQKSCRYHLNSDFFLLPWLQYLVIP